MVRPEPHQPLDKADIGGGRGIEARFGLVLDELLRQRRLTRLLFSCGSVEGNLRGLVAGLRKLLCARRQFLPGALLRLKLKDRTRRGGARWQCGGDLPGARTIKLLKQSAARVGRNGGDRVAQWSEAEPVRCERRSLRPTRDHDILLGAAYHLSSVTFIMAKVTSLDTEPS